MSKPDKRHTNLGIEVMAADELTEEEAMARLDPCPFCGSQAELWGNSYEGYAVVCRSCAAKLGWDENCFPEGHFYNHDFAKQHLAIDAWNTRNE